MIDRFLFKKIDNSPLILFRIFFGILIACECYGAIVTGWVRINLVEPKFTFNFIGFDWLQLFVGNGMYIYFVIMGSLGILIALGYKYRFSMVAFTILWTGVYLLQKTSYNNHYYLLILISFLMIFMPAHRAISLDAKKNTSIKTNTMPNWVKWVIIAQLFIVYTYASLAKLYGDWLDFSFIKLLMQGKANYFLIGEFLQQSSAHKIVAIFGILFDFLIVPALLWKPTRKIAFCFAVFFHLFNSFVFQIGIFPYLSLVFTVFFFDGKTIKNIFFKKKTLYTAKEIETPSYRRIFVIGTSIYFCIQLVLPIRHHFIKDNVLWTEEGHRLSWRMMLRSRSGTIIFKVKDKETGKVETIKTSDYLTKKQTRRIAVYPDFIWQFAQRLKKEYAKKGQNIEVHAVNSRASINGKASVPFIDPQVDLASIPWKPFSHSEWIFPSKEGNK
ncbi:hypothetical protein GGR42_002258 [Saonia flava]|uniref:HTTM-like domain-containing protein n=1 Tax=Saonia flava TaxID=523696 RepID=A0A846QS25_9FLAO|nr:HTTM domain-containing protein [Saonia flava]NJB71796.1 hypothetical protein [Saonia flava]